MRFRLIFYCKALIDIVLSGFVRCFPFSDVARQQLRTIEVFLVSRMGGIVNYVVHDINPVATERKVC